MPVLILCIYIAIIPIVLSFCKAAGIDERFREGEEYIENDSNK
ncbi:hypothetical protein [Clostridium septicum]|nr:hypothetical protein [Clostridium septicum]MDU1313035.1 hypothetical protein [Clostridium septicum]WLF69293.1 hypothetical protein Q6375_15155 [Clostridium septicum]